jgi:PAP2 superfamily protein
MSPPENPWTTIAVATAVGALTGGALIALFGTHHGWRAVFFVNLPIGAHDRRGPEAHGAFHKRFTRSALHGHWPGTNVVDNRLLSGRSGGRSSLTGRPLPRASGEDACSRGYRRHGRGVRGIRFSSVTATDLAHVRDEEAVDSGFGHWVAVRRGVLVLYFISLGVWSAHYGIPVQRELVVAWVCGALACASLGRPWRRTLRLVRDWLPMLILLSAYDFTRGAADTLGIGVHVHPMIDFDRFLFFGTTPTQWLQAHVNNPRVVNWLDVAFTLIYTSYFIVPFVVAGLLWARDRLEFIRFSRRLVTVFAVGVATYIAFPAAPPWMAANMGLLHGVTRTTSDGWQVIGGRTVELFNEGQASVNEVAAVPSLHSAVTMLVALFLWPRLPRPLRPLLLLYPLAMALTLMATGEHYFFDVLLGWIYAGSVMSAWSWWERRRARVTVRDRSRPRRHGLPASRSEARVPGDDL